MYVDFVNDINQLTSDSWRFPSCMGLTQGLHINANGNPSLNKLKLNNFDENTLVSLRWSILILHRDLPYFDQYFLNCLFFGMFFSEASRSFEDKFNPYSTWKLFNYLKNGYHFSLSLLFFQSNIPLIILIWDGF